MKLDRELVKAVATLLCQHAATHNDFFLSLSEEMANHNYSLEAHQQGIQGTHILVVHVPDESR